MKTKKHNHTLTNILKVFVFSLMILMPFIIFIPNAFYYGFNESAVSQEKTEYDKIPINFNQLVPNGNFEYLGNWISSNSNYGVVSVQDNIITWNCTSPVQTYTFYSGIVQSSDYLSIPYDHKLYFKLSVMPSIQQTIAVYGLQGGANTYSYSLNQPNINEWNDLNFIFPDRNIGTNPITKFRVCYGNPISNLVTGISLKVKNFNVFDLTQMFGAGNEPSIEQFDNWFPNDYYEYTLGANTYITDYNSPIITDMSITDSMSYAWKSTWQNELFSWTGTTAIYTGINATTSGIGISENSYIANYLAYIFLLTVIYVIVDIILGVFTMLTHIFNKEPK